MGRGDWYRRTSWSEADRNEFFARLNRTRSRPNRAQYLLIQAEALRQGGRRELLSPALGLVEVMLSEYPEPVFLARAHLLQGRCLLGLGHWEEALDAYRQALQAERRFPQVRTGADLEFGWAVVEHARTDLYDEALVYLEETATPSPFPVDAYRRHAILALIAQARGRTDVARDHAAAALEAAAQRHSGMRYHPAVGLVTDTDTPVHLRLTALVLPRH